MDNCIFCKIISGEIPSSKVYEDDKVLAFLDISQATKGHTLVIPKEHVRNILEMSAKNAETVFSRVPRYGSDDGIHMSFDEHEPDFAALANLADSIAKEVTE